MRSIAYLSILTQIATISATRLHQRQSNGTDVLKFIDPLIGTQNGGNVFAGATLPYGMAKAVADVDGANTGGFATDGSNVTGFSALHDSGTGGNPSLGNFPIFPQVCPEEDINSCKYSIAARATQYQNDSITARPGYFGVSLANGIHVDMTVSERSALFRFDFAKVSSTNSSSSNPLVLLDLTDLWKSRQNASINIEATEGATSGRIKGNGTFLPSFGSGSYKAYFCLDLSGATVKDSGVWVNDRAGTEPKELFVPRGFNNFYLQAGGFVRFTGPLSGPLVARMGLSFISTDQACRNAEREIPNPDVDFDRLVKSAEDTWREKLAPISIEAGDVDQSMLVNFWSAAYRTMISPQNYTGENPHWQSTEPYFDSFYCIWDLWRAQLPFLTILDPGMISVFVRSLLDTYKHRGWLPDCMMSTCRGWTQGGSNADNVLVDAYIKNVTTGIDWNLAYEAIVNDAENEPFEWSYQGRGGLTSWKRLNYIPALDFDPVGFGTNSRSISRTLEYAYNDYNLAVLAHSLGKDTAAKYFARAGNWENLYKADQKSFINGSDTGFVGFFQPRYLNGTFGFQDPIACSPLSNFCSLTSNPSETFESSVWEYMFFVPHNVAKLIELAGGEDEFISRINFFHTSGLADIGNEPVFLTVSLPHYAGRPALSAERAHYYIPSRFNTAPDGLPGNDDSGSMASFTLFHMMGVFPNPGQNVYLITPPFFPSVSVTNKVTNATATIRTVNFDKQYKNIYIQSATLDGKEYTRNWIGHEFFTKGGTLELVLGSKESAWGTSKESRPPSMSDSEGKVAGMELRF